MHCAPLPLAALFFITLVAHGAEPQPAILPDPIPPAVRTAAAKLARSGVVELFDVLNLDHRILYQLRLVDAATNKPALATFAEDGSLVTIAPIPPRDPPVQPAAPRLDPLPTATDPGEPHRADGRDAAPETRQGLAEPSH